MVGGIRPLIHVYLHTHIHGKCACMRQLCYTFRELKQLWLIFHRMQAKQQSSKISPRVLSNFFFFLLKHKTKEAIWRGSCSFFGLYCSRGIRTHYYHGGEHGCRYSPGALGAHILTNKKEPWRMCWGQEEAFETISPPPSDTPSMQPLTKYSNAQDLWESGHLKSFHPT